MSSSSKVSSAKQKKLQKKAAQKMKQEAKEALYNQTKAIYAIPDLLEGFTPFKSYTKNGLDLRLEILPISKLPIDHFVWAFELLKSNMEKMYEEAWGWSDSGKKSELREHNALYLLAYEKDPDGKEIPVAYSHFRFDYEGDKGTNVLYMYELQLEERVRGKGLGKFMMQILELLAIKHSLPFLMFTVFKSNTGAMTFYQKLKYEMDSTSPGKRSVKQILEEGDEPYEILSKSFQR